MHKRKSNILKSDVLKGIKEIEDILGFLTPEKLGKDFADLQINVI